MRVKKAKGLRRIARMIVGQRGGKIWEMTTEYKQLKKTYKQQKGEL